MDESLKCVWPECPNPVTGRQLLYCSPKCKAKLQVYRRRRAMKARAVAYKGGKCLDCGFDGHQAVLHFHHTSSDKDFAVGSASRLSWETIRAEIDKCDLLCTRCHGLRHAQEWDARYDAVVAEVERREKLSGQVHGTRLSYTYYRCRCDLCRGAQNEYMKQRRTKKREAEK